ncbi:MAG TPA: Si-specific NAD(P)(+) transhydrogenase [Thermoanaerobaculia bacterium]|jgi:NAD(P) transhydrogenase|nr:Si-specific NAD(P)(+) transhydrogenase [Thermoanaerobaculia bacterium]
MYDLIVIGSGPAGEKGAAQAAYFGKRVALIEREPVVGGASVNTGTIPSKTLRESALHLSGFRQRGFEERERGGITVESFMRREKIVVRSEWRRIESNLRRHDVESIQGSASFQSPHEIRVGDRVLEGEVILIATGSSPARPAEVPFDDVAICDSDTILRIDQIPKSLAIVGAGVIGCEYASIFAALGVDVHLIDGRTTLLPHIDREIVRILLGELQNLGVTLHLGVDVDTIANLSSRAESRELVLLSMKDGSRVDVAKVLYAAGRTSNTASLNLEAAGVATGKRGQIPVNDQYQTNVPNIYAAGDVIGFPALASTSMEQARVAMVHAFDLKYKRAVASTLPYAIYTIPELSTIGLTEEQCAQNGQTCAVGRAFYRNNARGQIIGDAKGMIKLVFAPDTLKLLGVHIIGEDAAELLHVGMMVMQFGGTINAFIEGVFNFPTLSEAYKYAAYDGLGNVGRARSVSGREAM